MRCLVAFWVLSGCVLAQDGAPIGITRGQLSLLLVRGAHGSIDLKTAAGTVYQCDFDAQTLIERDNLPIPASSLEKGEQVELLGDRKRGRCYARILRIVNARPTTSAASRSRLKFSTNAIEHLYPRGNLTFSGVILRMNPTMLVLRTRTEPEKIVQLREDTRYLDSGGPGDSANLKVNTRVFIRGGKTFEDNTEAYTIIWGEIPGPKSRNSF
jgi:hypothetical protein